MKNLKTILIMAACALMLGITSKAQAQGRGNFDPAQIRERMVDSFRDRLSVTNDDEWKVIGAAIGKVFDAQLEARAGAIRGMGNMRRNRGGNNGGGNTDSTTNSGDNANGNGGRRNRGGNGNGNGFGPTPSPEAEALQKAIDDKAPADEIKTKLAALRDANIASEAKLTGAQEDLKKLLTSRQEAIAVLYGLLK